MGCTLNLKSLNFNPCQGWLSGMQHVVYHGLHPWLLNTSTLSGSDRGVLTLQSLYQRQINNLIASGSKDVIQEILKGFNKSKPMHSVAATHILNNNPEGIEKYPLSFSSPLTLKGFNKSKPMQSVGSTHIHNNNPEGDEKYPLSISSPQTLEGFNKSNPMQSVGATHTQNNNPEGVENYPLSFSSPLTLKGFNKSNPMQSVGSIHIHNNNPEGVELKRHIAT